MKVTVIPIVISALGTVTKGLLEGFAELGNKRICGDHSSYNIAEIGQNTEKGPGASRRLVVSLKL